MQPDLDLPEDPVGMDFHAQLLRHQQEESASTDSSSDKLTVRVTDVSQQ